ncbi:MAG: hypothetical protein A4E62_01838 [Syntrophorhabdus sp. PtaU1.Bin002]|nr:MAG: hypothetical protein A4E62_01838 [Syntrophorhabdus sp. PtaU1.Bin002]
MFRKTILSAALIFLSVATAWAVKITLFVDMDFYIKRGRQIVIAEFVAAHDLNLNGDGLYTAEVNVVRVLAGQTKLGKLRVLTIHPMTRGVRYMLYSLTDPPDFQAIPELSIIALPERFDLGELDQKNLREQLLTIFETRLFHVRHELEQRRAEQKLLEKALGKTKKL